MARVGGVPWDGSETGSWAARERSPDQKRRRSHAGWPVCGVAMGWCWAARERKPDRHAQYVCAGGRLGWAGGVAAVPLSRSSGGWRSLCTARTEQPTQLNSTQLNSGSMCSSRTRRIAQY